MSNKKPELLGKFVYIDLPPKEESKIIVDENTKEELNRQTLKKMSRLKLWAVGDAANPKLHDAFKNKKDVLVKPGALTKADLVPFDEGGEEPVMRALILDYDIIHIWP